MHFNPKKDVATLVVFVFAAVSWFYAFSLYERHELNIFLFIGEWVEDVVFDYRLVEMRMQNKVEALPIPVYDVLLKDVDDSWGVARTEGRTHEGTDIFASYGTPVFSVTDGYVVNTYFGHRGGNNVMVFGPGGMYYYYAHFERLAANVERGMKVSPDTVLGYVGTSGNAEGTPPLLHFGIYTRPWDAINPYPFFVDRWDR